MFFFGVWSFPDSWSASSISISYPVKSEDATTYDDSPSDTLRRHSWGTAPHKENVHTKCRDLPGAVYQKNGQTVDTCGTLDQRDPGVQVGVLLGVRFVRVLLSVFHRAWKALGSWYLCILFVCSSRQSVHVMSCTAIPARPFAQ